LIQGNDADLPLRQRAIAMYSLLAAVLLTIWDLYS
jgi:hypothetical protein